jgi:predicted ArsR family transcriptional regulator
MKTRERILRKIDDYRGCTNEALVASDLRLSVDTVKKHVRALTCEGLVERAWDGKGLFTTNKGMAALADMDFMSSKTVA